MNPSEVRQPAATDPAVRSAAIKNRLDALVVRARKATEEAIALRERALKIKELRDQCDQVVALRSAGILELVRAEAARSEEQAHRIGDLREGMNEQRELAVVTGEAAHRHWEDLGVLAGQEFERWGESIEQMHDLNEKARVELRARIEQGEERWGTRRSAAPPVEEKPAS